MKIAGTNAANALSFHVGVLAVGMICSTFSGNAMNGKKIGFHIKEKLIVRLRTFKRFKWELSFRCCFNLFFEVLPVN